MQPNTIDSVFEKIKKMPIEDQDKIVALFTHLETDSSSSTPINMSRLAKLIAEVEEELIWETKFTNSKSKLIAMADDAESDFDLGNCKPCE